MSSSGQKAGTAPKRSVKAPEPLARACPQPVTQPVTFSRATPLRSVSDVDPFMRVSRPYS